MLPTSASFLVTENCNLACTYCFEKHNAKSMTVEVAKKALEFLSDNAIKNGGREFHAMLFGGEPLLNIDLVDEIFHIGEKLAKQKGLRFSTSIITNATIMNKAVYEVLEHHRDTSNLSVQLSVDGTEAIHDTYRVTKSGAGSFKLVEKNIPKFKELFEDCPSRLCIHGCVNKQSLPSLFESYSFFKYDWGFKNIWFLPVAEEQWDADDIEIYRDQNNKIYEDIVKTLNETKDIKDVYDYAPMDRCMMTGRSKKPCGAGDSFVTITAEGELYPCHQIYFNDPNKETIIGNVFDGIDEDARRLYVQYDSSFIDCPKDCENDHCYRCLASNYVHNGSIFSQIKGSYCGLMSVDREFQVKLRKEVEALGLVKAPQPQQVNCLCNSRDGNACNGCDVVHRQENCESGNNPSNPDCLCDSRGGSDQGPDAGQMFRAPIPKQDQLDDDFKDTVAMALQVILEKLESIEQRLEQKD